MIRGAQAVVSFQAKEKELRGKGREDLHVRVELVDIKRCLRGWFQAVWTRDAAQKETMGSACRRRAAPHQRYRAPLFSDIMGSLAREETCNEFQRCFSLFPRAEKKRGFCLARVWCAVYGGKEVTCSS